jgi:ankyrin repeat protein
MVDNLHCTSLHKAVFHSHEGIAEILLSSGASVSEQDKFGNTPLCIAVREGKLEMVRLLVSHGADVNAHYNEFNLTPLHRASADGQREMVKLLLSKGAKLNVKNRDGYTPLKIAKLYRRKDIYELLHKHGAR